MTGETQGKRVQEESGTDENSRRIDRPADFDRAAYRDGVKIAREISGEFKEELQKIRKRK